MVMSMLIGREGRDLWFGMIAWISMTSEEIRLDWHTDLIHTYIISFVNLIDMLKSSWWYKQTEFLNPPAIISLQRRTSSQPVSAASRPARPSPNLSFGAIARQVTYFGFLFRFSHSLPLLLLEVLHRCLDRFGPLRICLGRQPRRAVGTGIRQT